MFYLNSTKPLVAQLFQLQNVFYSLRLDLYFGHKNALANLPSNERIYTFLLREYTLLCVGYTFARTISNAVSLNLNSSLDIMFLMGSPTDLVLILSIKTMDHSN